MSSISVDLIGPAKRAPMHEHIGALLEIVGEGTKPTAKGNLSLEATKAVATAIGREVEFDTPIDRVYKTHSMTEVPSVELPFFWAKKAGLVRSSKGMLVKTPRGRRFGDDPLVDFTELFECFLKKLRWPEHKSVYWTEPHFYAPEITASIPSLLSKACEEEELDLTLVAGSATMAFAEGYDLSGLTPWQLDNLPDYVAWDIWQGVLVPLGLLGAFDLTGYAPPHSEQGPTEDKSARITSLGRWGCMLVGLSIWHGPEV